MRLMICRALASLLIVFSLLLSTASLAAAQAQRIAVSGTQTLYFIDGAGRFWTTAGTTHFAEPTEGTFAYSGNGISLSGTFSRVDHGWFDAGGTGNVDGMVTYVDASSGTTCQGSSVGKVTNFALVGSVNARCSDGSLLQGTWRDTTVLFDSQGNVIGVAGTFSGTLLIPSG